MSGAQIFFPSVGRRYLVHVVTDGGYDFIGLCTGHDLETVTISPCRHITDELSALVVTTLPDELTLSRIDAIFEEWL